MAACLGDEDVLLASRRKDSDVMGCRTSKVLPEPPADVQLDLVKKVEPHQTDVYKNFNVGDVGADKTLIKICAAQLK